MSPNALQNSSQSDLSLPINWTLYPATPNDNGTMTANHTQGDQHNPTSLTTTVLGFTLANPGAVQVVSMAPIWVRTTTTTTATTTRPPTTVHTTLQRAPCHRRPAWTYLKPEVYNSDGERRRIKYSPSTSSPSNSSPPSPPLPRGTSQSPPAMSSVVTSAYQTAPSGPVSPPNLPSPPRSDHGLQGQDEGTHYLGEGTQRYLGGCRAVRWHRLGEGYNWHYYILVPNVAGYLEPAQWLAATPEAPEPVVFGQTNFISPIYVEPLHA